MTIAITSGEPAGIGPDLCLQLSKHSFNDDIVILGDSKVFAERAHTLACDFDIRPYEQGKKQSFSFLDYPALASVEPGVLNAMNAKHVLEMITRAAQGCLSGEFSSMVTAAIQKSIIIDAGYTFSGHTEFLAELTGSDEVVMMLCYRGLRVTLVTTHLPLAEVPAAITKQRLLKTIQSVNKSLKDLFGLSNPSIKVAGLNPHAGESGHLGREEIDVIAPALKEAKQLGINVSGPWPADTMFSPQHRQNTDAYLCMYHDQGLPVVKALGFGKVVNVTLGLPIIRTSVDHGTALDLAGTGKANVESLIAAIEMAINITANQNQNQNQNHA